MCLYQFLNGKQCQLEDAGQGLCYWHDPTVDKSGENLCSKLETYMDTPLISTVLGYISFKKPIF
jgi:hypothetical protein